MKPLAIASAPTKRLVTKLSMTDASNKAQSKFIRFIVQFFLVFYVDFYVLLRISNTIIYLSFFDVAKIWVFI